MHSRLAKEDDIQGILDLQSKNLFANLSESERQLGFVTTPFTTDQLEILVRQNGLFVAEGPQGVVGYTMAASWDYFSQWPIFPFMISRLSGSIFEGSRVSAQNSFQYGPVCIESGLRGTDAFPRLFEVMRMELSAHYPVGITFINRVNERSYQAHVRKLGMLLIDEFEFSGRQYYGLAFNTTRSVMNTS